MFCLKTERGLSLNRKNRIDLTKYKMSIVSQNLKYLRKRSGITQEQMANKIGIKRSLLGAYEEGRADPRLNNLLKISEIYGISVDKLIDEDLTSNPPMEAIPTDKIQTRTRP